MSKLSVLLLKLDLGTWVQEVAASIPGLANFVPRINGISATGLIPPPPLLTIFEYICRKAASGLARIC